jgi:endoplasmic reticulum-Golgi intermediate compartment protein 3
MSSSVNPTYGPNLSSSGEDGVARTASDSGSEEPCLLAGTATSPARDGVSYSGYHRGFPRSNRGSEGLRRRTFDASVTASQSIGIIRSQTPQRDVVKSLDFMFPKIDEDFTVRTKGGGVASLVAYILVAVLVIAETVTWIGQRRVQMEHIAVDTSLGKRMRVNLNITFPSLSCVDLHVDAIDVAGDSQIDVDDTLKKRQLHLDGRAFSMEEILVETNYHRQQQESKERILIGELPHDYCGPCFGAHDTPQQCCQTCDEVLVAYTKKRWKTDLLKYTAEQCIREGRDRSEPKLVTKGQGCNLSGYMTVNRVSGNFHVAMGEGIERDGRHIHTFMPEDAPNFNASHIIHQLNFGPEGGKEPLNGVTKIVTDDTGTTGLFQYFIKVVPTTYVGEIPAQNGDRNPAALPEEVKNSALFGFKKRQVLETNHYFFTERFRPLMTELLEEHHKDKDEPKNAIVDTSHGGGHANQDYHKVQNSVLPGVFFIYEIYPFCVEISQDSVPFTHLLVRLMATVGGVFTLIRWCDTCLYERGWKNHQF